MRYFDVFNGDADGICALHQLRLAEPLDSELITGVKRDIKLLERVDAGNSDRVTVLDISLDKNRDDLVRILDGGASVFYCDHHFAGDIPASKCLDVHINTDANVCTSLLINDYLDGVYLPWAVAAAFGDNLYDAARTAADPLNLSGEKLAQLEQLGTLINYNGYGVTLDDLHFHPADLYHAISPFADPFAFIAESSDFAMLDQGYTEDMAQVQSLKAVVEERHVALFMLPDAPWARRVSGVYGNELARDFPDRAHALATVLPSGDYRVSVRAPLSNKSGADELCMQFPTGGGRKAAAGVNRLPVDMFEAFVASFREMYS